MAKENDDFDYVLDELAKSALRSLLMDDSDSNNVLAMQHILVNLAGNDSDEVIASKASCALMLTGFVLPEFKMKELVETTREKCFKHVLALQHAYTSIEEFGCTGEEALAAIQKSLNFEL